ncbi:sulfatase family protein [Rhodopirellula baltica]|uniref:sulfatase family protein n=1 Tax=Rhodopirellula baltica TaxID=265606 RepID=UPI00068E508F|nr:sulfatase-like hydrolase/transferase [Rhodopirellula baltica]
MPTLPVSRTRAINLSVLVAFASLMAFSIWIGNASAADRPNVILLMGDDHGWDETGYNGHPHLQTPILDQMAATGLRLDRFYAAHPTCSPTRGSVITGRHPNRYGTFTPNYSIRPEEIGVASLLKQADYHTAHFGKWHLGPVKASSPTNPGAFGFDEWLSHDNFFELNPWLSRNGGPPQQFHGESSELLIDHAIEFLQKVPSDEPFFLVIWYGSPHEPYSGLPGDLALYDELPSQFADQTTRLTSNETGLPVQRPLGEVLRERYAEITAMDRSIGTLRQWLAANELRDNTLLWYCGDNGTSGDGIVTSPLRGQKSDLYDGGIRVPGLIEWPAKIGQPTTSQIPSVTTDILPTLCELAGVAVPRRPLDGVSLVPLLEGRMKQRNQPICFWSFDHRRESNQDPYLPEDAQQGTTPLVKLMRGNATRNFVNYHHREIESQDFGGTRVILDDRYKLVVSADGSKELYAMSTDPNETKNVLANQPEIAQSLTDQLQAWQQSVLESLTGQDY